MISLVENRREEIVAACRRHGVGRLDLFGSAAGKDFDPGRSDLDFVAASGRMEPPDLFDREVDLVMEGRPARIGVSPRVRTRSVSPCMRPERALRHLGQIKDSDTFVMAATEDKTLADYSGDRILLHAVERNPEIVGVAVGHLRRNDSETARS